MTAISRKGRAAGRASDRSWFQVLVFASVALLLSLLVWKVVHGSSGASLVAAIKRGDRPAAPAFDLPFIWDRPEMWPRRVRPALADGRISG